MSHEGGFMCEAEWGNCLDQIDAVANLLMWGLANVDYHPNQQISTIKKNINQTIPDLSRSSVYDFSAVLTSLLPSTGALKERCSR